MEESVAKQIMQDYILQNRRNLIDEIDIEHPQLKFVPQEEADAYYKFRATYRGSFYYLDEFTQTSNTHFFVLPIYLYVDAETGEVWEQQDATKKPSAKEKRMARKEKRQSRQQKRSYDI
ncbi:MAG: hypothetical protein KME17_31130 [Cyanosarcina radialis HA8281-LM2]|nr:hypothetical protein [Cyanosarcina radialis HA8281-LM2]